MTTTTRMAFAEDDTPAPRLYALKPLYNSLISRQGVPTCALNDDGTLEANDIPVDFQGIEVEPWAVRFLTDMDRFFAAPFCAALYSDPILRPLMQSLLDSRKLLLEKIPQDLVALYTIPDLQAQEQITNAREILKCHLEVSLSRGYSTSAIIQLDQASFLPIFSHTEQALTSITCGERPTEPVPLRNFPPLPLLLAQTAYAACTEGPDLSLRETALWNYGVAYSHQHERQDEVLVSVRFNHHKAAACHFLRLGADRLELFTELARYLAVADRLQPMLEGVANLTTGRSDIDETRFTILKNSLETFALLVANITKSWSTRPSPLCTNQEKSGDEPGFRFRARVMRRDSASSGQELDYLALVRLSDSPGPEDRWPVLTCRTDDDGPQLLVAIPVGIDGTTVHFQAPPGVSLSGKWPVFTLEWQELNVSQWQNGTATLSVERNRLCFGKDGLENTDFLFTTAEVHAPDQVTPFNVWNTSFHITGAPGPNYVKTALEDTFQILFPQAMLPENPALRIAVNISHAQGVEFDLQATDVGLLPQVPCAFFPNLTLDGQTARMLQAVVNDLNDTKNLGSKAGAWIFALTLYPSTTLPRELPHLTNNSISQSSIHCVECAAPLLTILLVLPRRDSLFSPCTS